MSLSDRRLDALARRIDQRLSAGLPVQPAHIMEFATSPEFLGKSLYPRQGTALKVFGLASELLTPYDLAEVIPSWTAGYQAQVDGDEAHWGGSEGTPPDLLDRIEWCRADGRKWFREVLFIIGRRGSKGYLTAIAASWVLWQLLSVGDPQAHYGLDPNKRLAFIVFAGKKDQAVRNQFRDFAKTIQEAACFRQFHPHFTADSIVLFTPAQLARGIDTTKPDNALIEIRAGETTGLSARGPSVPMLMMDEFAHLLGAGSTASSTDLYNSAVPAREEFGRDGIVVQTSSPWDRHGQLWDSFQRACAMEPTTGAAVNPDFFSLQLPSWALYRDWERAHTIPMWPDGPCYPAQKKAVIEYNDQQSRQEDANPDTFAVEYRAQWRSSLSAYLPAEFVNRVFAPYKGAVLTEQTEGPLGTVYAAHGDPSVSGANFGFAIAHLEYDDDTVPHLVYDVTHHWDPRDFPDGIINYREVEDDIMEWVKKFPIHNLSFDAWNSAGSIQRIQAAADAANLPYKVNVFVRQSTAALNWKMYELLKTAIGHNIVHAPDDKLARAELEALQLENGKVTCPTVGPTRTKDVADSVTNVAYTLIGPNGDELFARLAGLSPRLSNPGRQEVNHDQVTFDALSRLRPRGYDPGARRGYGRNPARGSWRPGGRPRRPW